MSNYLRIRFWNFAQYLNMRVFYFQNQTQHIFVCFSVSWMVVPKQNNCTGTWCYYDIIWFGSLFVIMVRKSQRCWWSKIKFLIILTDLTIGTFKILFLFWYFCNNFLIMKLQEFLPFQSQIKSFKAIPQKACWGYINFIGHIICFLFITLKYGSIIMFIWVKFN